MGRHVVRTLVSAGWWVRALVRPSQMTTFASSFPSVAVSPGDLSDVGAVRRACDGVQALIHCAALMAGAEWASRREFYQVNVDGTRHVLQAAVEQGVRRVLHISTVGVLGTPSLIPADETAPYGKHLSVYEWSKREAERLVLEWIQEKKIEGTILRLAQLYGPGMVYGWAQTFRAIRDGSMRVAGRGDALLHLTHVDDVVQAICLALEHPDRTAGEVFHVAGPEALPIRGVLYTAADLMGVARPKHVPYALVHGVAIALSVVPYRLKPPALRLLTPHRVKFFRRDHVYDISKAESRLGYRPQVKVLDGFKRWLNEPPSR